MVGTDFFPSVDAGLMKLHFRAPTGTRIEKTEALVARGRGRASARIIPAREIETINVMIGVPHLLQPGLRADRQRQRRWTRRSSSRSSPSTHPTAGYMRRIRDDARRATSRAATVYFQPADIVSQVLNFGLSAPIDVQVESADLQKGYEIARASCATASPRSPAPPTRTSCR